MANCAETEKFARKLRLDVLKMINFGRSSHIGAVFSTADILAVLYKSVLRYRSAEPAWPERDRFILSKGHAGAGIYAALAEAVFFPLEWLDSYCADGSLLSGHVAHKGVPGVELSTGSLGHGLPVGAGMGYSLKLDGNPGRVFVLLGDGECAEGTTWETALFAAHHRLSNLNVIVDHNRMQGLGFCKDILEVSPLADKWAAFGWEVFEVDGHSHAELHEVFARPATDRPRCIVANTVKGKGVSYMENNLAWHYRTPLEENFDQAMRELGEGC